MLRVFVIAREFELEMAVKCSDENLYVETWELIEVNDLILSWTAGSDHSL